MSHSTRTPAQQAAYERLMGDARTVPQQQRDGIITHPAATPVDDAPAAYTVRVLWEGQLVQEDALFTDAQQDAAYTCFDAAVTLFSSSAPHASGGVSVQLFNASGDILAETFVA